MKRTTAEDLHQSDDILGQVIHVVAIPRDFALTLTAEIETYATIAVLQIRDDTVILSATEQEAMREDNGFGTAPLLFDMQRYAVHFQL